LRVLVPPRATHSVRHRKGRQRRATRQIGQQWRAAGRGCLRAL
jgi:hypothetical protein